MTISSIPTIIVSLRSRLFQRLIAALVKQAQHHGLILELPDGRQFLFTELENSLEQPDDFAEEIQKTCQNPELMQLLHDRAQEPATLSMAEVRSRLGL